VVGIATAVITAVLAAVTLAVVSWVGLQVPWLATSSWIAGSSLLLGLTAGLAYGGLAAIQYSRLRAAFQQSGSIPDEYVHFLDYAAERSLLRKVGGGYTFMHALLLDYFSGRMEHERPGTAEPTV